MQQKSIPERRILMYHCLPSGGAKKLYNLNAEYLKKYYKVNKRSLSIQSNNFIQYLFNALIKVRKVEKRIATWANNKCDLAIVYHSWYVKSPYILRYLRIPSIYICHEVQREFHEHSHINQQSLKNKIINFLRLPIKYADLSNINNSRLMAIVCNSHNSRKRISNIYGSDLRLEVIYPGIDTSLYRSSKPRSINLISVGSINSLKRQDFFVDVMSKLPNKTNITLTLVGNGGDQKYIDMIKKRASEKNIRVRILLNISSNDLINEYSRSYLYLYAPIDEPFGISVLEAMAAGLPIICYSKGGGYVEILRNHNNGAIIDSLNPNTWAIKVNEFILDKKRWKKVSETNRVYVKNNFDQAIMNRKIYQLLKRI